MISITDWPPVMRTTVQNLLMIESTIAYMRNRKRDTLYKAKGSLRLISMRRDHESVAGHHMSSLQVTLVRSADCGC